MPVFKEVAHSGRDLRIFPSKAPALPRLASEPAADHSSPEKYEVMVIGAGPAGLFCTLLLARYGVKSLACFDAKPGTLKAGQADGLQPRTLEVLKSLGVADEFLNDGCHMSEVAFWNPKVTSNAGGGHENGEKQVGGVERTSYVPDVHVSARYPHEVTIHQGRIERVLEENLHMYAGQETIQRSHRFLDFEFDEAGDAEFPIAVSLETDNSDGQVIRKSVRAKYLIGGDGAHSQVRKSMGLQLTGESTDHIWGVVDFVASTDFPDIRRRSAIHSDAGSVMVIPREQISTGEYLTRLYVQVADEVVPDVATVGGKKGDPLTGREKRAAITLDYIFNQAGKVFAPYTIKVKEGTTVDWWAAYQIGQRMTPKSSLRAPDGQDRVFIVGDACHTHSPKAGQGMNVSMMDSFNLSWKLAHSLLGLTPPFPKGGFDPVLATFQDERLNVARQLIEFDSKFSSMFSGQIGVSSPEVESLTHDQFLKVFKDGSGFTSGCGIEYEPGLLVKSLDGQHESPIRKHDPLSGTLKPGRRLLNVQVKRHADSNMRNLQDDLPSTGRYRLLVFTSTDLLDPSGQSSAALNGLCQRVIGNHPAGSVELVVVHPLQKRFEWTEVPTCVKEFAEMKFHGPHKDEVYSIYGISDAEGAVAVIRPDGIVAMVSQLSAWHSVGTFLSGCLVTRS